MNILSILILLVHDMATVVLIGHYLLIAVIYQPFFKKTLSFGETCTAMVTMIRGGRVWVYKSLAAFAVTGVALMLTNQNYMGVGQFVNSWSWLMGAKHAVIVAMVVLVFWINGLINPKAALRLAQVKWLPKIALNPVMMVRLQAGLGVLVLALTALARG